MKPQPKVVKAWIKKLWKKIHFLWWWYVRATEEQKGDWYWLVYGSKIMKDGKAINPKKFYL